VHPDHTYNVTAPVATDDTGALYAQDAGNVAIFPEGSFTPKRMITLSDGYEPYPGALGVDRDGFLFVTAYIGSAQRFGTSSLGATSSCQASDLEIFGPKANGSVQPVVCYQLTPFATAFDEDDDLFFISQYNAPVNVLNKAHSGGGTIAQIGSANMTNPVAVATIAGQLYVAIAGPNNWLIDVFPTTARAETAPTRVIYAPRDAYPTSVYSLAVDANYLYVGGLQRHTVHGHTSSDFVLTVVNRLARGNAKAVSVSAYPWVKGWFAPTAAVGR
jgi:hypothetical protein